MPHDVNVAAERDVVRVRLDGVVARARLDVRVAVAAAGVEAVGTWSRTHAGEE